ncbi:DUF6668 family protein [Yinghuangia sp. YIM S09857]|uniref:DUF6668 family protein n=1 Tax=Yinghuangia sp. YIM S09857 TaxID=3436929 RepID=UPI003F52E338
MSSGRPPNPWLPRPTPVAGPAGEPDPPADAAARPRPAAVRPQAGLAAEPASAGPGFRSLPVDAPNPPWWWVGCHGGAGVSTLVAAVPGGRDAERAWPLPPDRRTNRVVLVARTNSDGLHAAQDAARQWAAGRVPGVTVLGLAAVADAPGRLPRPLAALLHLVGGGVPRLWVVPWIDALRLGRPLPAAMPKGLRTLEAELGLLRVELSGGS